MTVLQTQNKNDRVHRPREGRVNGSYKRGEVERAVPAKMNRKNKLHTQNLRRHAQNLPTHRKLVIKY